ITQPATDTMPPTTAITCNGSACAAAYNAPVTISLSASDTGGSGVDRTVYTTEGSDPATSATAVTYAGALAVAQTAAVRYFSTDTPAHHDPPPMQITQAATVATPPTAAITCDASAGAADSTGPVTMSLSASDTDGSGVDRTV